MDDRPPLSAIDPEMLVPIVRRVLRREVIDIADWTIDPLAHFVVIESTGGLYRVAGAARVGQAVMPWSMVLKILRKPTDEGDPTSPFYWKREWLAYESGLLDNLPGHLAVPRFFGVTERPNGDGWLWTEEIVETTPRPWPLSTYGIAARDLGSFNGAYLVGQPVPTFPWLSSLRTAMGKGSGWEAHMDPSRPGNAWESALVRRMVPPGIKSGVLGIWAEMEQFIDVLDRLPQVLCHYDAYLKNLMMRRGADGQEQTVAIDWAFTGPGTAGADIGGLVMDSAFGFAIDPANVARLDAIVFPAYLEGLRNAGWQGDAQLIRLGYTAYIAFRHAASILGWTSWLLEGDARPATVEHLGRPAEEIMSGWIRLTAFALERADEARALMARF